MIARYIFLVYIFLFFLFITMSRNACKIATASIIFLRRDFMIMAISAEIMLQKSGLAFISNFHPINANV
jgi:NADH:ubiquinone oxidoreductase subunit K